MSNRLNVGNYRINSQPDSHPSFYGGNSISLIVYKLLPYKVKAITSS